MECTEQWSRIGFKAAELAGHGSFVGRHYSKLVVKFKGKQQEVHNLEKKLLSGEWDPTECQSQRPSGESVGSFPVTSLCFCLTSLCFYSESKMFPCLAGRPGPFAFHLFPWWSLESRICLLRFLRFWAQRAGEPDFALLSLLFSQSGLSVTILVKVFPFSYWACLIFLSYWEKRLFF